jgi:hypothetical protein
MEDVEYTFANNALVSQQKQAKNKLKRIAGLWQRMPQGNKLRERDI